MKPLPTTFIKNTFTYEQILREGNVAIYKQRLRSGVGCLAFEVFRIRPQKAYHIFGKDIEAHEIGPDNESFGKIAWTYPTLEKAKAKMRELMEEDKKGKTK